MSILYFPTSPTWFAEKRELDKKEWAIQEKRNAKRTRRDWARLRLMMYEDRMKNNPNYHGRAPYEEKKG